jgi:hypothetical protein
MLYYSFIFFDQHPYSDVDLVLNDFGHLFGKPSASILLPEKLLVSLKSVFGKLILEKSYSSRFAGL